jgi:hypothetical protein
MSQGVGPNLILPGGEAMWRSITGQGVFDSQKNPPQMFGSDPLGYGNRTIDYGRQGLFVSRGPQSTQYDPTAQWSQIQTPAGVRGALFGASGSPGFGQSSYDRFNDSGSSYLRRYGTDVREDPMHPGIALQPEIDAHGNPVGFGQGVSPNPAYYDPKNKTLIESPERSAGQRSGALFGGRGEQGQPLFGSQYDTAKTYAGLTQLQQGANPWLNNPTLAAQMSQYQELASPFTRANPAQYLQTAMGAEGTGPSGGAMADRYVEPTYNMGGRGVSQMGGLSNAYEQQLMDQIANQGSKDLSLGLQDAQSTLSSMGLGRSGQGQSTAAGVWADIQQKNALDRSQLLANFREANMNRVGQAVMGQQKGGIDALLAAQQAAAGSAESRLGRMNQAAMGGLAAQTQSLEASRAAERGALGQGMLNTAGWNQNVGGNYLNALQSGDTAALNRMNAESAGQSLGLHDYMSLQQTKDQMRSDRLNEMLGLEDRYRTSQNEVLNQMQQYGMYGPNALMQMITGIAPTGGSPARTNPYGALIGQLGGAAIGALPGAYTAYHNQYDPGAREYP